MKNKEIIFVTSNKGKVASAQQHLQGIELKTYDYDLIEPRSDDIQEIATSKVLQAFELVKKPCIALDAGFFIDALNGFPRAFVNFALDTLGIEGILRTMSGITNRQCAFKECLAYYDGHIMQHFISKQKGTLATEIKGQDNPEKWSDLWYIFIPEYSTNNKTLAEYSVAETQARREKNDSAIKKFAAWY